MSDDYYTAARDFTCWTVGDLLAEQARQRARHLDLIDAGDRLEQALDDARDASEAYYLEHLAPVDEELARRAWKLAGDQTAVAPPLSAESLERDERGLACVYDSDQRLRLHHSIGAFPVFSVMANGLRFRCPTPGCPATPPPEPVPYGASLVLCGGCNTEQRVPQSLWNMVTAPE